MKNIFLLLLLFGLVFAGDISDCATLSTHNELYTLTDDVAETGATCFTIDAENVTLDCDGYSVVGDNTASTYGIYSTEDNTTLIDCKIRGFLHGVYYLGANNGLIERVEANTTMASGGGIVLNTNSDNNVINNSNGTSQNWLGILIWTASDNNIINNSRGNATGSSVGLRAGIWTSSNTGTQVLNSVGQSKAGTATTEGGLVLYAAKNAIIQNSTFIGDGASALLLTASSDSNNIINNTFESKNAADPAIRVTLGDDNLFYHNNITGDLWFDVVESGNFFNTTDEGNIYYWINGTGAWEVYDITASSGSWADGGTDRPFDSDLTEWTGNGADYHPYVKPEVIACVNASLNISNNTITATTGTGIFFGELVCNSTAYHNNITAETWINNTNKTNTFNTTGQGNIYYFANETASWDVYDIIASSGDWADGGTDVPLNASLTEWLGLGNDSHPWAGGATIVVGTRPYIWDGTNWVEYNGATTIDFRCEISVSGFPIWCQSTNQDNTTAQPIFRIQNNGTGASSWQAIQTNATWGTQATVYCGTNTNPLVDSVNLTTTLTNYTENELAVGYNNSLYCFFRISRIDADFQRNFNVSFENG